MAWRIAQNLHLVGVGIRADHVDLDGDVDLLSELEVLKLRRLISADCGGVDRCELHEEVPRWSFKQQLSSIQA